MKENILEVDIFGKVYRIRSQKDPEYLEKLAKYVDQKMREVQDVAPTADGLKIAVLTALNIADELFETKLHSEGDSGYVEDRIKQLSGKIQEVLEEER